MASNRIGKELMNTFYGGSFIAGPTGEIRAQVRCMVEQGACGAVHCVCMNIMCKCVVLTRLCLLCIDWEKD